MKTETTLFRPATARGHANHGWLDSWHTFSFAGYHDPDWVGFGPLRVINDDRIAPRSGFPMHPHRDMEIMTYIVSGELRHEDSMGQVGILHAGDFQRMSAGTGVVHSEFNASATATLHLYQIWVEPLHRGNAPRYGELAGVGVAGPGETILAAPESEGAGLPIDQHLRLVLHRLSPHETRDLNPRNAASLWIQGVAGDVTLSGQKVTAGDALALDRPGTVGATSNSGAQLLVFEGTQEI